MKLLVAPFGLEPKSYALQAYAAMPFQLHRAIKTWSERQDLNQHILRF